MKTGHELYELIAVLSKNEKGYFKKYALKGGKKENDYMVLFDFIDRFLKTHPLDYDGLDIKIDKRPKLKAKLAAKKNYLYKLLLSALTEFHKNKEPEYEVMELYTQGLTLRRKGLYGQSVKIWEKALLKAEAIETFEWMAKIIEQLMSVYSFKLDLLPKGKTIPDYLDYLQKTLLDQTMNTRFFVNQHQLSYFKNTKTFVDSTDMVQQKEALFTQYYEAEKPDTHSSKVLINYWMQVHYRAHLLSSAAGRLSAHLEIIKLKEAKPNLEGENYKYFHRHYYGAAQDSIIVEKYDQAQEYIDKFMLLEPNNEYEAKIQLNSFYALNIVKNVSVFDYEKVMYFANAYLAILKEREWAVDMSVQVMIIYYGVLGSFIVSNYHACLEWLQLFYEAEKKKLLVSVGSPLRILEIITHYELKNYDLLPYLIRNAYRFHLKNRKLLETEKEIFDFLRKQNKLVEQSDLKKLFVDKEERLKELWQDIRELNYRQFFDVHAWLKSKISGKSYLDHFIENADYYAEFYD